jgi:hypothetical protein
MISFREPRRRPAFSPGLTDCTAGERFGASARSLAVLIKKAR